ncbi:MAG: hypothetical protein ABIH50_05030 [bacterium]
MKKMIFSLSLLLLGSSFTFAITPEDQDYINKLDYQRNKLEIRSRTRIVNENRSYSSTDINTQTYSFEAYSQTYGNVSTSALQKSEVKERTEWAVFKGQIKRLSDLEFLNLVGDQAESARIAGLEANRSNLSSIGTYSIGLGIAAMIGGAAFSAGQPVIIGGALTTTVGFFISAFNSPPRHYVEPDYAQQKIDEYNINLKKKLNLPLDYN